MSTRFLDTCLLDSNAARLYATGGGIYVANKGRFGVPGFQPSGGSHAGTPLLLDNPNTGLFATAFSPVNPSTTKALFGLYDTANGVDQVSARIDTGGILRFYRGSNGPNLGGTLLGTALGAFPIDLINHLEIKVFVNNVTGTIEVRLNGQAAPIFTFTGNTRQSANSFFDALRLYDGGFFSDIHLFDTANPTGSDPHDFLGNKRLITLDTDTDGSLGPNDGTASPAQSAGSHHLNLDEFPPNEDTDYVALAAGQKETLGFGSVPGNVAGIVQVSLFPRWRVDDAQAHTARVNCLSGGSTANGVTKNPPATYATDQGNHFPVNPNGGGAWTSGAVNAMEGQIEVQT